MMKQKINSTRTYDAEGFRKRAACLCFKNELKNEVLLVSSSAYPNLWVASGGGLEPNEEPGRAAVRELMEEAGVRGRVLRFLGTFENSMRKHRTAVYMLVVTEELEQWEDKRE
ncbi:LOW QUALITY PROTEIN: diphosphoinositol polyphosphate phosphohydrolase 2-like [Amphiura filiformis]|uniref:LOW QUALITY PROTEIN: diphosphoinositol polyphosphate phosphohydrolase 2-like n=1 Tax=Amphiura filiformis TaxID=82378 RepID=UPI003B227498